MKFSYFKGNYPYLTFYEGNESTMQCLSLIHIQMCIRDRMLADRDGDGEAGTGNLPNPGHIGDDDDVRYFFISSLKLQ